MTTKVMLPEDGSRIELYVDEPHGRVDLLVWEQDDNAYSPGLVNLTAKEAIKLATILLESVLALQDTNADSK